MRVFAAICIPEGTKKKLLEASRYFSFRGVTLVKTDALHITLHFFGEIDEKKVGMVKDAMDSIETGSFRVTLHGIGFFRPERIRIAYAGISDGADKVIGLRNALLHKLRIHDEERFVPHATIARVRGMRDRKAFLELATEYEDYDFGSFTVDSVSLMNSRLSAEGPRYEELYKCEL